MMLKKTVGRGPWAVVSTGQSFTAHRALPTAHFLAVFIILAFSFSCTRHTRVSRSVPAAPEQSSPVMKRQILNAIDAGEGDILGKGLRQKVAAEPDNLKVRLELAEHYRKNGYPELAVEHCRVAAARFPDSPEIQLVMAKAMREMGLRVEAADVLQKLLEQKPQTDPAYYSWLGILRDELSQWKQGEACHRSALTLANLDYLHNNLGYNLLRQGKKEQAAEEFRKALSLKPNSVIARNNLGLAVASNKQEALAAWKSVSGPAAAHNNLASVLIEQGQYVEAQKELEKALEYNRSNSAILGNLRLVSEMQGKPVVLPNTQKESHLRRALAVTWRAFSGADSPKPKAEKEPEVARTASE